MTRPFDSYRPPVEPRKKRKRKDPGRMGGGKDSMVGTFRFESYYGKPVVKAPPWEAPIPIYLALGGLAGGSSLLAVGALATGRKKLLRNTRIAAIGAGAIGSLALVADLGRPERFLNMFRVFKLSSPMSIGSWILGAFSACAGLGVLGEVDDLLGRKIPLPKFVRKLIHKVAGPATVGAGVFGAPLAMYTSVLLGDTSVPTWNAAKERLPFVFVSSGAMAASGMAMLTTPVEEAKPARILGITGAACDLLAMQAMEKRMDPVAAEPLHEGDPGALLKWSELAAITGAVATLVAGRWRLPAAAAGASMVAASVLTRFGIFGAGIESVKNPRYTILPQKRRLAERRACGEVGNSITTAG
ncbi:nitrite reductase [Corynebacterium atypicum]|uniref:Nitrite reductase n=1 Tax=Corynebacterium atypicum TaxID=191610 RepID=A0ABM5QNN6_9CORY|nr:NrfD/PsrC family molybdoenzyme membrane anchor subunit [Corynebacterium atypicum]AIG64379.1 nitrite reductase [Corynebacterium atypicum]